MKRVAIWFLVLSGCSSYPCEDPNQCDREVGTPEVAAIEPGFVLEGDGRGGHEWVRYTRPGHPCAPFIKTREGLECSP